ncbi:MAG: hypothetical protein QOC56_1543, partial [Alphaproteobacteria bacterium]|nr:hypothetical protein [Alphaproteobacteria bacterium]
MPSTAILRIDYRASPRELLVTFVSGKIYAYDGVAERVYAAFLAAPSRGKFFNAHIRDR